MSGTPLKITITFQIRSDPRSKLESKYCLKSDEAYGTLVADKISDTSQRKYTFLLARFPLQVLYQKMRVN